MKSVINKTFKYLEPLWTGRDEKISLRACMAIFLGWDFVTTMRYATQKWAADRSLEGLSLVLGIEAGLIATLLGLNVWSNLQHKKIDREYPNDDPSAPKVEVPE